ncbi:MAG: UbiD family decarboxylase, partial [Pseudomonadota bacterium]|nr:UbiD family decarboxylase [Pseudomonadota bacterium]
MKYQDLRDFLDQLALRQQLRRIDVTVDPNLEMTEVSDRILRVGGPALLFERPTGFRIPVLTNLFGTTSRVAMGMGRENTAEMRELGQLLAFLKEPEPPKGLREIWQQLPIFKQILTMSPKIVKQGLCQTHSVEGDGVDLSQLPIQTCWPGDAGPLITWGLVVTKGPLHPRQNLGIYRQQVI